MVEGDHRQSHSQVIQCSLIASVHSYAFDLFMQRRAPILKRRQQIEAAKLDHLFGGACTLWHAGLVWDDKWKLTFKGDGPDVHDICHGYRPSPLPSRPHGMRWSPNIRQMLKQGPT